MAVSLAPDASWAMAVRQNGLVQTWANGTVVRKRWVPVGAGEPVVAAALSDNVVRVLWAAWGDRGVLRLYERASDALPRHDTFVASAPVRAVALSPSASAIVVACGDGTLRGLDVRTGEFGWTLDTGERVAHAVAMASDNGPVAAAFADGTVRRYDLRAGTSDIVGHDPQARAVAITPDGEVVVTAGADGRLFRWDPRTGAPPKLRVLGTVITAVAVERGGDRALVGAGDGRLWLHDFTGGPGVEYIVPTPERTRNTGGEGGRLLPHPRRVVDDDVRFTVYRPQVLSPGRWASLLVFVHKTTLVVEPGHPPVDPQQQVEARARAHFGGTPPRPIGEDAPPGLPRGAQLRIVPDLPGIQCNPRDAELEWWEPVHEASFRLLAGPELAGTAVRGAVRVWCGALILGEVSITVQVAADGPAAESPPAVESAQRYRKIFPSYSHQDRAVVARFAEVVRALGDQYLQDVLALRAGERWDARLLELIEEADVFQLFWSRNSMRSPHCQQEWEHALALQRPLFVRPLYWEDPLPEDPQQELPPASLRALHFVKVPAGAGPIRPPSAPGGVPTGHMSGARAGPPPTFPPTPRRQRRDVLALSPSKRWRVVRVLAALLVLLLAVIGVILVLHSIGR